MRISSLDRSALLAGVVSRGLLFVLLVVGSQISFVRKVDGGTVWETRTVLHQARLMPELLRVTMPGDSWWYRSLATEDAPAVA